MPPGKSLRIRRLFSNGRALTIGLDHGADDPPAVVRMLQRCGADAVVLSPGMLDRVVDDLGDLGVILRINAPGTPPMEFIDVPGALALGADAVLVAVDIAAAGDLARLARVTDDGRRFGVPVVADMLQHDLPSALGAVSEFGADVIVTRSGATHPNLRRAVRAVATPVLIAPAPGSSVDYVLRSVYRCLESAAQGIVLDPGPESLVTAVHQLVHQGVTVEEALLAVVPEFRDAAGPSR
jgi:DhnA family fructose-bisphosphate aldolase class Ia